MRPTSDRQLATRHAQARHQHLGDVRLGQLGRAVDLRTLAGVARQGVRVACALTRAMASMRSALGSVSPLRDAYAPSRTTLSARHVLGSLAKMANSRRLAKRLEIHFTPKHGSWLNVAEIELRVLTVQCLDRRIPERATLEREVAAWEEQRNSVSAAVDWQFTTEDARRKLKRLYPHVQG